MVNGEFSKYPLSIFMIFSQKTGIFEQKIKS